ncbi:hypothetical protein MFLAVUS_001741 [Mucor flavus]|uniref:Uncharacterized protein n=1 Tax=Mucor flavus TaxID=439312 RepID=A0ABP9YNB7_9FUNG
MTDEDLIAILNKCSIQKPIHVLKISRDLTHIHFENEANASSFYHLYRNNSHILCRKFKDIVIKPGRENGVDISYDISLCQRRVDEDTFGWCTCLIPSPSSIANTTDNNANNDTNNENVPATSSTVNTVDSNANNDTNNISVPSASSNVNTTDSNASNDTNNENIPVASSNVNTTEKHNTSLKRLIQELKDEIKEDEERLERKRKKLKLLQDAYEF